MFPNLIHVKSLKKQQGSMLVIALFVLIVLAFLAYAMIQITDNSSRGNVYEVYGTRALNAANSGAERALNEVFGPGNSGQCANVDTGGIGGYELGAGSTSVTGAAFSGCKIKVNCEQFDVAATGYTHFRITSTASCSAGEFETQRSIAVEARL